jgi:hypothetical protein
MVKPIKYIVLFVFGAIVYACTPTPKPMPWQLKYNCERTDWTRHSDNSLSKTVCRGRVKLNSCECNWDIVEPYIRLEDLK